MRVLALGMGSQTPGRMEEAELLHAHRA